jgi:hypothetical protein
MFSKSSTHLSQITIDSNLPCILHLQRLERGKAEDFQKYSIYDLVGSIIISNFLELFGRFLGLPGESSNKISTISSGF